MTLMLLKVYEPLTWTVLLHLTTKQAYFLYASKIHTHTFTPCHTAHLLESFNVNTVIIGEIKELNNSIRCR